METGQIIQIGLELIGIAVVWVLFFIASLWAAEKVTNLYNYLRASFGYDAEVDEHETHF